MPTPPPRATDPARPNEHTRVGDHRPRGTGRPPQGSIACGVRLGRYDLREPIDGPAGGAIYLAYGPHLRRDVVIRVPDASQPIDPVALGALAKLEQPGLGPVADIDASAEPPYLVMPLVAHTPLAAWLHDERPTWRRVAQTMLSVGTAIEAAHRAGLAHPSFSVESVLIGNDTPAIADLDRFVRPCDVSAIRDASTHAFARAWLLTIEQTSAPAWLRDRLAGVAASPTAATELGRLLRDVQRRLTCRSRVVRSTLVLLVLAGVALGWRATHVPRSPALCGDPSSRLVGIWDPDVRRRTITAFTATGVTYAHETLARLLPAVDDYAARWRAMHVEICRATFVEKRQPGDVLDRRMTCLDRRLGELRSRTSAFANADPEVVRRASEVVAGLPAIADCEHTDASRVSQPLPSEPIERARIEARFREIDDVRAAAFHGGPSDYLARATRLAEQTAAEPYLPLRVRALRLLVDAQVANKAPRTATYRELAEVAARAHDDVSEALAWSRLVFMLANAGQFDEARTLGLAAEAAVKRAGSPPAAVEPYETAMSVLATNTDDWEGATSHGRAAVAAAPNSIARKTALENLAMTQLLRGEVHEANRLVEEALALVEQAQGPRHPSYATTLLLLARIAQRSERPGDLERARKAYDQAVQLFRETLGEQSEALGEAYTSYGFLLRAMNRLADAEQMFTKAIEIYERTKNTFMGSAPLKGLADTIADARGVRAATPVYDRAIRAAVAASGPDSFEVAAVETNLALGLADQGDCRTARSYTDHAMKVFRTVGSGDGESSLLTMLAKCDIREHALEAGIQKLERAVSLCASGACSVGNVHYMRRDLGMQLVESRRDRRRGLELVRAARDGFASISMADNVAEVDAWLKKHAR